MACFSFKFDALRTLCPVLSRGKARLLSGTLQADRRTAIRSVESRWVFGEAAEKRASRRVMRASVCGENKETAVSLCDSVNESDDRNDGEMASEMRRNGILLYKEKLETLEWEISKRTFFWARGKGAPCLKYNEWHQIGRV